MDGHFPIREDSMRIVSSLSLLMSLLLFASLAQAAPVRYALPTPGVV
ncbi:MAG: hypothetical protein Kow00128_18540 [Deltaproteobacteria bacterium]